MAPLATTPSEASFPHISGYTITEQLYNGSRTAVYRAMSSAQKPVVIKIMRQSHPDFSELVNFRNQYAITKDLPIPSIVRPLSLEQWQNGYALIMENFGGISLQTYAKERQAQENPLTLTETLAIAVQIADTLHELCQHRVVHKDIKPANILIHPDSRQVKLIDFSIATLLPKEIQESQHPNGLEGSLAYIAPEQTGRMNRGIDYRTDFYSFGVTLYELLTGELPFLTQEPLEIVHCHIAKLPKAPHLLNPELPPVVSQIVLRLMAKNAEDRYQSALGLKHDLAQCLIQWKKTGKVDDFELGQRDVSDRFLIPEKLYGREAEVQSLLEAFDRVSQGGSEMMLVAGFSGVGKTAVINEVHKPITRQHGYFIKGKFDQFNRNIPFSAFVQAFRSLMGQLLTEADEQRAQWKTKILESVGDNGQVIVDVIPELETIIGPQPDLPELAGSAAQHRFNLVFGKFVQMFATLEHPLVLFLDDLQWADLASLALLKRLINDADLEAEASCLLVLGAYRDNEVFPAHPLMLTLEELQQQGTTLNTMTLAPLGETNITHLLADTLGCSSTLAAPLAQLTYQKTQGNPFFTAQFLQGLHAQSLIKFDVEAGYWQCDIAQVRSLALTDNVVAFMIGRLQQLPTATQNVLKLAACIGNQFDLETLSIVNESTQEQVAADLWQSLKAGLIIPENETYKFFQEQQQDEKGTTNIAVRFRFLHDRVQQAAYALIPEDQKQVMHMQVGQLLLANTPVDQQEGKIFEITNHLNKCIEHCHQQAERSELLRLNCIAGKRAKETTAYASAISYYQSAKQLLPPDSWQQCCETTLEIYFNLAEVYYLSGDFQQSLALVEQIVASAESPVSQAEALNLAIIQCTLQGKFLEALEYGQKALACLGFELSEVDLEEKLEAYQKKIQEKIGDRATDQLIHEPDLNTLEKEAREKGTSIKILNNLFVPAYVSQKGDLYFVIALIIVDISLEFGMVAESGFGFSSYGMFLGNLRGNYQSGYEFGLLAQALAKRFDQGHDLCKAAYILGNNLLPWVQPFRDSEAIFNQGLAAGLASGELVFAGQILMYKPLNPFYAGDNLFEIQKTLPQHLEFGTKTLNYQLALDVMNGLSIWLADITDCPDESVLAEQQYIDICEANSSTYAICHYWILKAKVLCLYGDYEASLQAAQSAEDIIDVIIGKYQVAALNFYQSIAVVEHCRRHGLAPDSRYLQKVQENQEKLKVWAESCPENFAHKYYLVAAVLASFRGQRTQALDLFNQAIQGAKTNRFAQEEALANELAAQSCFDWGQEQAAADHMQAAYYGYAHWGAETKTKQLEERFPQLLQPVLTTPAQSLNVFETISAVATTHTSIHATTHASRSTSSLNNALDLAAVLQASQAISSTIEIEALLYQLTTVILQSSGGDHCTLLLPDSAGEWQVQAIATAETTALCADAVNGNPNLPVKLIHYVKNTGSVVIVDDLKTDLPIVDDYLNEQQPKSLLCLPLLNQGQAVGILYLSNQCTSGVFAEERLLTLKLFCSQAAISIKNARLYQQAQSYAEQLEASQLKTVQSEKMASLGNLVAGVAHEINNPIGFLNGSINNASGYLADLQSQLDLYKKHHPDAAEPVLENAEDIDLDFVCEDFPKLLTSMKGATDRIKAISTSLRTFSRADTEHKVSANLIEGLDSTLLILKYRLKADENRPAIEVVKDYAELPNIDCFPGRLNQVFMNLLANAIDVFDEAAQKSTFEALKDKPQIVTIKAAVVPEKKAVEIRIGDNGKGMPEAVKARIFDHLFTTKGVGKGTGLGLAIAKQIIVEAHGGTLNVASELGQGTEFCIQLPF